MVGYVYWGAHLGRRTTCAYIYVLSLRSAKLKYTHSFVFLVTNAHTYIYVHLDAMVSTHECCIRVLPAYVSCIISSSSTCEWFGSVARTLNPRPTSLIWRRNWESLMHAQAHKHRSLRLCG